MRYIAVLPTLISIIGAEMVPESLKQTRQRRATAKSAVCPDADNWTGPDYTKVSTYTGTVPLACLSYGCSHTCTLDADGNIDSCACPAGMVLNKKTRHSCFHLESAWECIESSMVPADCASIPAIPDYHVQSSGSVKLADCGHLQCEGGCMINKITKQPECSCGMGYTLDKHDWYKQRCIKVKDPVIMVTGRPEYASFIREDKTIRPYNLLNFCIYHKRNGFTFREKIFGGKCVEHSRYHWSFTPSGLIMNHNQMNKNPHCWSVRNLNTNQKQSVELVPCNEEDPRQLFMKSNGRIKIRDPHSRICVMWNLKPKTRVWAQKCTELLFSQLETVRNEQPDINVPA